MAVPGNIVYFILFFENYQMQILGNQSLENGHSIYQEANHYYANGIKYQMIPIF